VTYGRDRNLVHDGNWRALLREGERGSIPPCTTDDCYVEREAREERSVLCITVLVRVVPERICGSSPLHNNYL
jgi:hypothetical protein